MKHPNRFSQFLCLLASLLVLSLVAPASSLAQDKSEPRYKPYPAKKRTEAAETSAQEADTRSSSSVNTASPTSPFGVTPTKSLQSRPPTSGKEPMMRLDSENKPLTEPVWNRGTGASGSAAKSALKVAACHERSGASRPTNTPSTAMAAGVMPGMRDA